MDQAKLEKGLKLLMFLTNNRYSTVQQVSERFEMTTRTFYRYIDTFRSAGFVVSKLPNKAFRIEKMSPFFKDISDLVYFSREEAYILSEAIHSVGGNNLLRQNLQKKLASIYDFHMVADIVIDPKQKDNVHNLVTAIEEGRQVYLLDYNSAHSNSVTDRLVEPFAFTTNFEQVWCYEVASRKVKHFMVSRIGKVEVTDDKWQYKKLHKQGYIDIFRFTGSRTYPVKLIMSVRAANLLMEEYPLSRKCLKSVKGNRWELETELCNFEGITRFILGLYDDIEIIESDDLKDFVKAKITKMRQL